jgi:hypothetical protein
MKLIIDIDTLKATKNLNKRLSLMAYQPNITEEDLQKLNALY